MNISSVDCGFSLYGWPELIAVTPYLIGYHPTDSVIVIGSGVDGALSVAIRADLVDATNPALAERLVAMVQETDARRVALLVYTSPDAPLPQQWQAQVGLLPYEELVDDIGALAHGAFLPVVAALYVGSGRWWSYHPCGNADCCSGGGNPMPDVASRAAAEATFAGIAPLPNRAALIASFDPVDEPHQQAMAPAVAAARQDLVDAARVRDVARWRVGVQVMLRAVLRRIATGDVPWLSDRVAARLAIGLTDRAVRDRAWLWVEDDPGNRWVAAELLWRQLARRAPEDLRAAPLFLAAWACWRGGDGIRARIGVEQALIRDPDYLAAQLLAEALNHQVDPRSVPSLDNGGGTPNLRAIGPKPANGRHPLALDRRHRSRSEDGLRVRTG